MHAWVRRDDLADHVEERVAFTRLRASSRDSMSATFDGVTGANAGTQPFRLDFMSQLGSAVVCPEKFKFVVVPVGPGKVVVEGVEVAIPTPADLPHEAEVHRSDEVLDGSNPSAINREPLRQATPVWRTMAFSGGAVRLGRLVRPGAFILGRSACA
jgi:hypothetical protein